MIKIVLSYEDNYIDRVEKIKEEFFDDVDYFYVEDYINKNILLDFTNNDIIYILNKFMITTWPYNLSYSFKMS